MDSASASARDDQVHLDLEIGLALDGARREELARLGLDRIRGLAVAVPERLRLGARRLGRLLPALLDVVQLARRLLHVLGLVEVVLLRQRFGLRDHLFLDGGVGEPLPLVHLAQLVELRPEHGQRRLQTLDQVLALVMRQRERRFDRGPEIARRLVRFLEREVVGLGALVGALDQLIDPLHLLAERLLGGRLLRFGALADRRVGRGVALQDRFVEPFGLLEQSAPFARHRVPRVGRTVFLRRELLGLARQLVEPRVGLGALLPVLVPGAGARAGIFEPLHELLVDGRFGIRGQPFPFRSRLLESIERIFTVDGFDQLAERHADGAAGGELRFARGFFGARLRLALDDRPDRPDRSLETAALGGGHVVGRGREQLAPRGLGVGELLLQAGRGRRRRQRLDPRDRRRDALLVLLEHRLPRRLGIVHGLDHRARALGHGLVLGAVGEPFEGRAIERAAGRRALERAQAGILVVGLHRDVERARRGRRSARPRPPRCGRRWRCARPSSATSRR